MNDIITLIKELGLPTAGLIIAVLALYRIGWFLAGAFTRHLEENTKEMRKQTKVLQEELPLICKAQCPSAGECINFRPINPGDSH